VKYLFYDIESCSGNYQDGSLCSFGYCLTDENFNVLKKEDILVNPAPKTFALLYGKKPRIHLAYEEGEFRKAGKFPLHYETIKSLFDEADMVIGYAVDNDVKYVNGNCDFYSLKRIKFSFIDVALIYKIISENKNLKKLEEVAANYEIEYTAHRSDEDAYATMLILKKILENEGLSLQELLEKYEIIPGINKEDRTRITYQKSLLDGRLETPRTHKQMDILYDAMDESLKDCKEPIKNILTNKNVIFNDKLRYGDPNYVRNLQKAMIKFNCRLVELPILARYFITCPGCKNERYYIGQRNKNGEKIKPIKEEEFISLLGEIEQNEFNNDSEIIVDSLEKNDEHARGYTKSYVSKDTSSSPFAVLLGDTKKGKK